LWLGGKLAALAVLGLSIALLRWLLIAPQFQIATVLISGNDLVPADEVAADLPLAGTNLFTIRGRRVAKSIERDPAVAQALVRPRLPNMLSIEIEERQPVVIWEEGDTRWLVDDDGRVLGSGDRPLDGLQEQLPSAVGSRDRSATLPVVAAPPELAIAPGQQVDVGVVRMARAVTPRLAELGLDAARLEYDPARGMAIIADGAYRVELGFGDQLDARLEAFETIFRYLQQSHTPVQLIDVRFLERPYFR
jgi:cell division protein FtsQ